jgi:soluble lytic murein transglycosylase-like protein
VKRKKLLFVSTVALILPFVLTCSTGLTNTSTTQVKRPTAEKIAENQERIPVSIPKAEDAGLFLYNHPATKLDVVDFFAGITGSERLALIIIRNADKHDVPLSLAFALSWAESEFNPMAVNRNPVSIDRGLFQLNDRSFPQLTGDDWFDPDLNADLGLGYFKWCLKQGGNEIVAIAIYNAGKFRVERGGTPRSTLDHINRILTFRDDIEERFHHYLATRPAVEIAMR